MIVPRALGENIASQIQDSTAPDGLRFYLSPAAKRLATPWQVAIDRAKRLAECDLPSGVILDPACGSGIQLAAYCKILSKPGIGIELSKEIGYSAAGNIWKIGVFERSEEADWLEYSKILIGDGTDAKSAVSKAEITEISFLHIDPARPLNSQTHGLEEMQPQLPIIFSKWSKYLGRVNGSPALLLDLSPRLNNSQCEVIEALVKNEFGEIEMTWEWTSRGGGRIDRLSLWTGPLAEAGTGCRFVRISPKYDGKTVVIKGKSPRSLRNIPSCESKGVRKNEYLTILDAALVSSGLAEDWVNSVLSDGDSFRWAVVGGRRPIIIHKLPLEISVPGEELLVQTSGCVEAFVGKELSESSIGKLASLADSLFIGPLTLRVSLSPELHPTLQGALRRLIKPSKKHHRGFVIDDPTSPQLLLCKRS